MHPLMAAKTPRILWVELTSKCPLDCVGDNARRTVEERFGWEAIAQRAFESYLTLLDRRQMPARRRLRQRERQCTL